MADGEPDVEKLAARLACLYVKESTGKTQKWERMGSADRSRWRLLARAAIEEIGSERPSAAQAEKAAPTGPLRRRRSA